MSDTTSVTGFNAPLQEVFDLGDVASWNQGGADFELIPEGPYTLELIGKTADEPVKAEYNPTGKKMRARFNFKVVDDPDYADKPVSDYYTISLNEKAPLHALVKALLGGKIPNDVRITQDLLKGKRIQAMVNHKQSKTNPDRSYYKINAPAPVRTRPNGKATEAAPAEADASQPPF